MVGANWLLGWSLTALAAAEPEARQKHLANARVHLTQALTRSRQIKLTEIGADILIALARCYWETGDPGEARHLAAEALSTADRGGYRLKQADIHNFLALLDLEAGDTASARKHAEIGMERAYCDGPPHYYKPAYEEAERLLAESG